MNIDALVGQKVMHGGLRGFGEGVIVDVKGETVFVDFKGEVKKFDINVFCQHFKFNDIETQDLMKETINEIKLMKALDEATKKAATEEAKKAEAKTAEKARIDRMFGTDYHVEHLSIDRSYKYQEVETEFGISIYGFGKGINATENTVVLISSVNAEADHFLYHDRWTVDGDYIYSGEGKTGDQKLIKGNLEVAKAASNNKKIHLLVKFSPQEYYYQGIFELIDYTYEDDEDDTGHIRKEYKFRIRKVSDV